MKHALSSLSELLRIEAGGVPAVPAEVLNNADINVPPDSLANVARTQPNTSNEGQVLLPLLFFSLPNTLRLFCWST